METESLVLGKLPFAVELTDEISLHAVSGSIYILRISSNKQTFLYGIDESIRSCNVFRLIWHEETLISDSVLVSSDGLVLVKTTKNDFCKFNITRETIIKESQLSVNDLKETMKSVGVTDNFTVMPVVLTNQNLVLRVNDKWLLMLEWQILKQPVVIACTSLENNINSCLANKEYIFTITVDGGLFIHKILDGTLLQKIDIWNWLPWRESYRLLAVSEEPDSLIALEDPCKFIYIFNLSCISNDTSNTKFDDTQSILSTSSGVSYKTTTTSMSSVSRTSSVAGINIAKQIYLNYNAADDLWFSYLDKLKKQQAHQGLTLKTSCNSVVKLEAAADNFLICNASFTDIGFSVCYTKADNLSTGLYRLHNSDNGQLIFSTSLQNGLRAFPFTTTTFKMDLFISRNSLYLPLYSAPKHGFVSKMLQCIDSRCIRMLFEDWKDMLNPNVLLQKALTDGHLDTVHLALNLHSHLVKSEVMGEGLVGASTKDILLTLIEITTSPTASEQFIKQIKGLQLTHSYRLLGILDEIRVPVAMQSDVAVIRNQIMESIVAARAGLESCVEGSAPAPPEHSVEWVLWDGMSDVDVLRVGASRLSAVQCFLAVKRGWTTEELSGPKFKELVIDAALHLLDKRDMDGAIHLITHTGFNKEEELREICLNSLNKNLIDFVIESSKELWNDCELEAWRFLTLVTTVINRYISCNKEESFFQYLPLSLTAVMSISEQKRQEVITELFFRTWDDCLLELLKKENCWKYLIESNCVEGLQVWLNMLSPPFQYPWPTTIFCKWSITQEMVDNINQLNCTESTKETLYNYLCLKGLFSTENKLNIRMMLKRLAETNSLMNIENLLNSKELCDDLLTFISDSNMVDLAVAIHDDLPSLVSLDSSKNQRHEVNWLDLLQSFLISSRTWDSEGVINIFQKTISFLTSGNKESYIKDHPLIILSSVLIENKSLLDISTDPLSISTLLPIGLPNTSNEKRETTLYSLLSGTTAFNTDTLFQWQKDVKNISKEIEPVFPHFGCKKLSIQYGHKQCLNYVDHLKQGRPSFAFVQFYHEFSNVHGNIPTRMRKRGVNVAHGLALQLFKDKDVGTSCVAFIEMLSRDSTLLRIHLACVDVICNAQYERGTNELRYILQGIILNKQESAELLLKLLQEALHSQLVTLIGDENIACLKLWLLPVKFARLHQLPLPESLLLYVAEKNNWLLFVTIVCLFNYPKWQVMNLTKNLKSEALKEHIIYSLQLKADNHGHYSNYLHSSRITKCLNDSEQLFSCIAEYGKHAEQLLLQARAQRCPGFALLASCFQERNLLACFCEWLAANLPKGHESIVPTSPMNWSNENVTLLFEHIVELSFIRTLYHGFSIFFPDNPIYLFTKFLLMTVEEKKFKESAAKVNSFKTSFISLEDNEDSFLTTKIWISETIIKLCSVALIKCFPAYSQQHLFLSTICDTSLTAELPVVGVNFQLLLSLTECLSNEGLTLDYSVICTNYENFNFEKQLQQLVYCGKFEVAHRFATIAGLSHGLILAVEWKEKAKRKSKDCIIIKFWESCDGAFVAGDLIPDQAISFYIEQADLTSSSQERYILLKYALKWINSMAVNKSKKHQELVVLHKIYHCFLQDNFNIELAVDDLSFKPLRCLRTSVVSPDTLEWFKEKCVPSLSKTQIERLDSLTVKLLEVGDLSTIWCLEALFEYKSKDSLILDGCIGLAEGEFSAENLPFNISQVLCEESSSSRVYSLTDSFVSQSMKMSDSFSSTFSFCEDIEKSDTTVNQEREDSLKMINLLAKNAVHCTRLVKYIQSALRIASKFNMQYKDVIEMENPLTLIERGCDDLLVAKDVIILANLPSDQTIFYLCSQLVKSVINSEKWVSGYYGLTDVLSLAEDPVRLGKLLSAAAHLTEPKAFNQTVELLILAHSCFTTACNMEGISEVLELCQKLTELLLANCHWSLMVRLLTGIGRYTEMRYIFNILKENQQFESLLSKGLDKYSGLKSATLEFVRGDKELFTLVALHFRMYSELAVMFEEKAVSYLDTLEPTEEGKIIRSDQSVQILQAALKAYTDAAQHYKQAKNLKRGVGIVNQAELIALQLSFLLKTEVGKSTDCLLRLQPSQVTSLITSTLSYEEACVIYHAYNVSVDWGAAIYQHCIIKSNHQYVVAWSRHYDLNYTIVQDIVRRFQEEKTLSDSVVLNMKQFIQMISQTDLKYRVSSQLGFKDILQILLSGPELPYLKDTVWQSGFKKQHF